MTSAPASNPATEGDAPARLLLRGIVNRFGTQAVHEGVDLELHSGEIMALVGGSGTGKTVLLRTALWLRRPQAGRVWWFGREVTRLSEARREPMRRRMGVLFQQGALFTSRTVLENARYPLDEHTRLSWPCRNRLARLKLDLAGLPASAAGKYPRELSGGMIKRAALARALALDPELLFLDEPTSGLDPVSAARFDELLLNLRDALGFSVLMISHDLDSMARTTDRVAFLARKTVLACAPLPELQRDPTPELRDYFAQREALSPDSAERAA